MRHVMKLVLCVGVFAATVVMPAVASAQALTLAYQYQRYNSPDSSDDDLSLPTGANIDLAIPVARNVSIFGQFDWSRDKETFFDIDATTTLLGFGGGIRVAADTDSGVSPFFDALFGGIRGKQTIEGLSCGSDCSSTDPMFQIGGGVFVPMGGWGPVVQADYRRVMPGEGEESFGGFRLVAGIRLGMR